jgi:hypothetical protein
LVKTLENRELLGIAKVRTDSWDLGIAAGVAEELDLLASSGRET